MRTPRTFLALALIAILTALLTPLAAAADRLTVPTAPLVAATRPRAVTSVETGTCGWQDGIMVTFDTGEVVMVSHTNMEKPFVGQVASFWRAYWSTDWPFWHAAGFTQTRPDGSGTGRITFTAC